MITDMTGYDYIIIGGGSAGCVVAARLSEDPAARVLLLEAGGHNRKLTVTMPLGLTFLVSKPNAQNWGFMGEPEPYLDNRRIYTPRGRGLGGTSAINGMVYIRGNAKDYDQWAQMGLRGWSFDDVLPYFRRSEDHEDGPDEYHGVGGPLHIMNAKPDDGICAAVIEAGVQAGYPRTDDFNGAQQEGFGWYDFNVKAGVRGSSSAMFLDPVLKRPNLTVKTSAHITRILIEGGRATGVNFVTGKGGQEQTARCDGEVIVCAGAFQSPHILQLSGIGDPARLKAAGIDAVHSLPGVGANLQDHLDVRVAHHSPMPAIYSRTKGARALALGLEYLLFKTGIAAQPPMLAGCFIKSGAVLDRPDMQLVFVDAVFTDKGPLKGDGFTFHLCQLHPESRGTVDARSTDPFEHPRILYNFMATERDRLAMRTCVKTSREIIAQDALAPYRGKEILPGQDVRTDAEIDAWVRANASTVYHPAGTCKMGIESDPMAVCDAQLKVRGIEGLRVADTSVMPVLVGGNTNAPAMMIGEKCADMIRSAASVAAPSAAA